MTDEIPVVLAELRNAISCELNAQLDLRGETLELADAAGVADAVAVRLWHTFRIEWAPPWAAETEDDQPLAALDTAVFHASTMPAGEDRYPIFDHR